MNSDYIIELLEQQLAAETALVRDLYNTMATMYDDGVYPGEPEFKAVEEAYQRARGAVACLKKIVEQVQHQIEIDIVNMAMWDRNKRGGGDEE